MSSQDNAVQLFLTPAHDCSYLSDREARTLFVDPSAPIDPETYRRLSAAGFRRSGENLYRPHCDTCQACQPSRVPVRLFKPRRRHRRVTRRNTDLRWQIEPAIFSEQHFLLYARYLASRHADGSMHPADETQFRSFLLCDWAQSSFLCGYLDNQLISVGVTDHILEGLSAIYTYYDPDHAERGLGVLSVLRQIQWAQELDLPYLYLGYAIADAQKMRYKFDYQPLEVLRNGQWLRHQPEP